MSVPRDDSREALPVRFGRYLLLDRVGAGGMADVYRAIASGAAGVSKLLCIKRIRRERLAESRLVSLFIDEASISMQLAHGGIVHTYDFGRVGDEYFLALELVDGVDLATLIRSSTLTVEETAAVGEALCSALHYAHTRRRPDGSPLGLVHRDVTPRNVLVTLDGEVKLADFGVATIRTRERGGMRGTLGYMAPEQASGGDVDARADVFSVASVLFECASGRPLLGQHPASEPTEPPAGMDDRLGPVLARALAFDRARRTSTAAEMADELGRIVAHARAAGAPDPRRGLAQRVATCAADRKTSQAQDADAAPDLRPATYYSMDGSAVDFAKRLGATELSRAETKSGASSRRRTVVTMAALVSAALVVGVVVLTWIPTVAPRQHEADTRTKAPFQTPTPAQEDLLPIVAVQETAGPHARESEPLPPSPRRHEPTRRRFVRAAAPARLDLNALPWAEVSIDGVPRGTTPLSGIELVAGFHRIRMSNPPLGVMQTFAIRLPAGERRQLVVDLRQGQPVRTGMANADQLETVQ